MSHDSRVVGTCAMEKIVSNINSLKWKPDMVVNPSQLEAVRLAINNRVALIQGPPGHYN